MKVIKKQTNSHRCIICGIDNPAGLAAPFYEMEDGSVMSLFSYKEEHQSYPERTHGGLITAMIDELIGRAIWVKEPETWGVTLKIEVEFHKPVPYNVPLKGIGAIDRSSHLTFDGHGEIYDLEGHLLARGTAVYYKLPLEKIASSTNHPEDINVLLPDDVKEIN